MTLTGAEGRYMRQPNGRYRKTRRAINEPGHAHELTFSCYRRLPLLARDRTRNWLLNAIDRARREHEMDLWAYVVMPDHTHLLLMPRRPVYEIADFEKAVKQSVARRALAWLREHDRRWLTRLAGERSGDRVRYHFWQPGAGYDRNIDEPATAWGSSNYLHENPVRAGLVANAVDWVWSSAREYAGLDNIVLPVNGRPPDFLH